MAFALPRTNRIQFFRTLKQLIFLTALLVTSCNCSPHKEPAPQLSIVYGGDLLLGNNANEALFSRQLRKRIFGNIAPILRDANIAMINAEGVIAKGGRHGYKPERNPILFRVHPNIIDAFKTTGIDVVTVGNNHVGDYGRDSFTEMLDLLSTAGIQYTGGGYNTADAREPAYFKLKDTTVAIIGANMSYTKIYAATETGAGTLHFNGLDEQIDDAVVTALSQMLQNARQHANLVFFSPHWGKGWTDETHPGIRKFARKLIDAGYDGILGHSAHRFHGAEVINGKPVLYDAGNFGIYWTVTDSIKNSVVYGENSSRGLLFKLVFSGNGVQKVIVYPLKLSKNSTNLASGPTKEAILDRFEQLSKTLGTTVIRKEDTAVISCRSHTDKPEQKKRLLKPFPKREKPDTIREAPANYIVEKLPGDAMPLDVRFSNGIELIGARILPPFVSSKRRTVLVSLYFRTSKKVDDFLKVHLHSQRESQNGGRSPKMFDYTHIPGDGVYPSTEWNVREIIQDTVLLRLKGIRKSEPVDLYTSLGNLTPSNSDTGIKDERLISIGTISYKDGAIDVKSILKRRSQSRR